MPAPPPDPGQSGVFAAVQNREQQAYAATFSSVQAVPDPQSLPGAESAPEYPQYKHPKKKWRLKTGATPQWYKARNGVRTRALSGAARVARYRPKKLN